MKKYNKIWRSLKHKTSQKMIWLIFLILLTAPSMKMMALLIRNWITSLKDHWMLLMRDPNLVLIMTWHPKKSQFNSIHLLKIATKFSLQIINKIIFLSKKILKFKNFSPANINNSIKMMDKKMKSQKRKRILMKRARLKSQAKAFKT